MPFKLKEWYFSTHNKSIIYAIPRIDDWLIIICPFYLKLGFDFVIFGEGL